MRQKKEIPWIFPIKTSPTARMRLFCFPYAGGSPQVFKSWADRLPAETEVFSILLPGRGARLFDPLYSDMDTLVPTIAKEIKPHLEKPFVFFGHSMGAMIGFELTHLLLEQHNRRPLHLILSGRFSPEHKSPRRPLHNLEDKELIEELKRLNGTPRELLEHEEMMELMLGSLRADFSVCETYRYQPKQPLPCPLTVFGGHEDPDVAEHQLVTWKNYTTGPFELEMFDGDHFFIQSNEVLVLKRINQILAPILPQIARAGL